MNKLYRFSPIQTHKELLQAISYIALETTKLCKKVTNKTYPISYLTVFAHYQNEYDKLKELLKNLGDETTASNGVAVRLHKPIKTDVGNIPKVRIRQPDPYRDQVGCDDFKVPDYQVFKKTFLTKHPENIRLIERSDYEMIEFFDPDFDVLAYVVNKEL